MKENEKLKNLLKHLYEGKEFHTSFEDEVYSFTYKFKVKKVYGKDSDAVASVDLIITDFQKDGDDFMWQWDEDRGIYNHGIWYIVELEERVGGEMMKDVPISIHLTIWSIDEYED